MYRACEDGGAGGGPFNIGRRLRMEKVQPTGDLPPQPCDRVSEFSNEGGKKHTCDTPFHL